MARLPERSNSLKGQPLPVIIDCDPGHDDALMLMLAFGSGLFDVRAVTTSAGNQTQDNTSRNALRVLTLIGAQVPVYRGADKPLLRALTLGDHVHGKTGLDGTDLPEPAFPLAPGTAVEALGRHVEASSERITLVVTGPQTNIAGFLLMFPQLKPKIERIVFMGGGIFRGNYTPLAEFNIHVDPEAAAVVLGSGIPIVMCGLDVTHKALFFQDDIELFRNLGNRTGKAVAELADFFSIYYRQHRPELGGGAAIHDACTIAWLINPSLFKSRPCHVTVELTGQHTTGATVVDFYDVLHKPPNAEVVYDVDREAFVGLLLEAIKTLP